MSNSLGFSANGIAFGGANVANVTIDASSANDAIALPIGPASSRPAGALGYLRFSTDLDTLEYYKSTGWAIPGSSNAFVWQNGTLVLAMPNNANIQFLNTGTSNIVVTANGSNQVNVSVTVNAAGITANSGGANTQIQYNNNGVLGASPNLTFNVTTNTFLAGANASFGNIADQTSGIGCCYVFDATKAAASEAVGGATFGIGDMVTPANNVTLYLRSTGTANIRSAGNIALTFNGGVTGLKGNAAGGFTFFAPTAATTALTVTGNTAAGQAILSQGKIQISGNSALNQGEIGIQNLAPGGGNWRIGDGISAANGIFTFYDSLNAGVRWLVDGTGLFSINQGLKINSPSTVINALDVTANNGTYNICQLNGLAPGGAGIRIRDALNATDRGYIGYGNNTIAGIGPSGFGICPATGGNTHIGTINGGASAVKVEGSNGEVVIQASAGAGRQAIRVSSPNNTDCYIDFAGNNTVSGLTSFVMGQAADSNAYIYQRANFNLYFGTNNTLRTTLDNTGRWNFGKPGSGAAATFNGAGSVITLNGDTIATSYLTWQTASVVKGYIGTDGGSILAGGSGTAFGIRSEGDLLLMGGGRDSVRVLAAGNLSAPAPTSGATIQIGALASTPGWYINGPTNAGFYVQAGVGSAYWISSLGANNSLLIGGNGGSMPTLAPIEIASTAVLFPTISTTASAGNAFLDSANRNNLLRSTSSIRYKTNVSSLLDADLLMQLRPITYTSKASSDDPTVLHYGLIAEEVANVTPMLVQYGKDEDGNSIPDGVQYDRLTVLLLKQIQTLTAQVATLTDRLNKLTANT